MSRNDSGLDLIFGIIGLIFDIALESNRYSDNGSFFGDDDFIFTKKSKSKNTKVLGDDILTSTDPLYASTMINHYKSIKNEKNPYQKTSNLKTSSTSATSKATPKVTNRVDVTPKVRKPVKVSTSAKQIKLEVLLLNYMFLEDDGKINLKERVTIKNHYKDFAKKLTNDDIEYIKDIKNMDSSLLNIRSYISQQNVTDTEVNNAIKTIRNIGRSSKKYHPIINRIESGLLDSIGY